MEDQIARIAALNEPVRRALYVYVATAGHDVSRDQAAQAVEISRPLAAFHLEKLVEEGLLQARFERLSGRTGPGAGRPSKLYRRACGEVRVALPPRSYELAGRIFARTLAAADSPGIIVTLHDVALSAGKEMGEEGRQTYGEDREPLHGTLAAAGYEPYSDGGGTIRLRNCPFHSLAQEHRGLVCGMNRALLQGLLLGFGKRELQAELEPLADGCCVALRPISSHPRV